MFEKVSLPRPRHPGLLLLSFLIACIIFFQVGTCGTANAQPSPDCPDGYKCVPDETAAKWKRILENRQCMDEALDAISAGDPTEDFQFTYEPYRIIVTDTGQVLDQDELNAILKWCDYELELQSKPNLRVMMKTEDPDAEPTWGFRLRVRLGANFWPRALWTDTDADLFEPVLLFEPFFVHQFHASLYGGTQSFGLVVGFDITRNLDVFVGMGARWKGVELGPVAGFSLSFN